MRFLNAIVCSVLLCSCSLQKLVVNETAQILKAGSRSFDREDDIQLAREALPASLKTMESFLEASPNNSTLLGLLSQGYFSYAFGFIEDDADKLSGYAFDQANATRKRAFALYLRGRSYGLRLLAQRHGELVRILESGETPPAKLLEKVTKRDVTALFWTANNWAAAINTARDEPMWISQLHIVRQLAARCVDLDESFFAGGPHTLLGSIEAALPTALGGQPDLARKHFLRAIELAGDTHLMNRVLYIRSVGVQNGERAWFVESLNDVLAAKSDTTPAYTLLNRLAQERARRYLELVNDLFLDEVLP